MLLDISMHTPPNRSQTPQTSSCAQALQLFLPIPPFLTDTTLLQTHSKRLGCVVSESRGIISSPSEPQHIFIGRNCKPTIRNMPSNSLAALGISCIRLTTPEPTPTQLLGIECPDFIQRGDEGSLTWAGILSKRLRVI